MLLPHALFRLMGCWGLLVISQLAAPAQTMADSFVASLSPEQRAAAGLEGLTSEQQTALDALVAQYRSGELAQAQAAAAAQARVETEQRLQKEITVKERESRLKGLMGIGRTDDLAFDAALTGTYRGFQKGTILTLDNGQRWVVTEGSYWAPRREGPVPVRVAPGALGSFWMQIDGGGRARVRLLE